MKKICMNVSVAEPFLPTAVQITRKYPCQAKKMIKVPVQFVVDLVPRTLLTTCILISVHAKALSFILKLYASSRGTLHSYIIFCARLFPIAHS